MTSTSLADDFHKNGYLVDLDVLSPEETKKYLDAFLAYEQHLGGQVTGSWRFKAHLLLPWMYELVTHPKILNVVKSIFGPDILCWSTDLFPKNPGTGKSCAWHQDSTYIGMNPPDALTVWVALTDSNEENGCVKYESGSHKKAQLPHTQTFKEDSMLLYGQEIPVENVDENKAVSAILRPGQASIHHVMTVHCSGPNNSSSRRIGIAVRYCGSYVKQAEGIGDSVTLACGKDMGNFPLEPKPEMAFGEAELQAHQKAVGAVGPQELIQIK